MRQEFHEKSWLLILAAFAAGFATVLSLSEKLDDPRVYCKALVAGLGATGLLKTPLISACERADEQLKD